MGCDVQQRLSHLLQEVDCAIEQAVINPSVFCGSATLANVEAACAALMKGSAASRLNKSLDEMKEIEALVWQLRARAGRLQMLLDSALQFYTSCFSLQPLNLAYSVLGESCGVESSTHLTIDC